MTTLITAAEETTPAVTPFLVIPPFVTALLRLLTPCRPRMKYSSKQGNGSAILSEAKLSDQFSELTN